MRISGKIAADVLDYIAPFVVQGITTNEIDKLCYFWVYPFFANGDSAK